MARRPKLAALVAIVSLLFGAVAWRSIPDALGAVATGLRCGGTHWVAAWTSAPQSSSLGKPDGAAFGVAEGEDRTFEDQTLRMHVVPHIGGDTFRVRFGNRFGLTEVTLGRVTVGTRADGAAVVPGSLRAVTFGGARTARIPAGGQLVSDPIAGPVRPFVAMSVSFHVVGRAPLDLHRWATSTHHATAPGAGDHTRDERGDAFVRQLGSVLAVASLDVLAPRSASAIVALGDSITDGMGSTPDLDLRWPDQLSRRLLETRPLSVVNAGIGGNHVATDGTVHPGAIGPSAVNRFPSDVAAVAGVTDVIVFEGINDIGAFDPATDGVTRVVDGYRSIIAQAHESGLRVIGATITPAGLQGFKETHRRAINRWIRSSGAFDAVLDFDAVIRDPAAWERVRPEHDAAMAHLTDEGYRLLAAAIDPAVFKGAAC